jgi:cytochrome P450
MAQCTEFWRLLSSVCVIATQYICLCAKQNSLFVQVLITCLEYDFLRNSLLGETLNPPTTLKSVPGQSIDSDQQSGRLRRIADLPGPRSLPLVGNMLDIDSLRFHSVLEQWAREYGTMFKVRLGRKTIVAISDNTLIASLLRDRPEALRRSSRTSKMLMELATHGVFTEEGDEWRKQRKLVMRGLTPEVIRRFFPKMVDMTERLRLRWTRAVEEGQAVDIARDLKAYALDVIIGLSMGQDINSLEHSDIPLQRDIEQVFYRIARRLTTPFPYWRYVKLPVDFAADACARRINSAVQGFIAETRRTLEVHPERHAKPTNMLEALLIARDEPESGFTDEHVIGNAITMVFAGEDTTSNTIAWLLNFLAQHPDAMRSIEQETDATLNEANVLQDFALLEQFPFLDAAANEAMRIKPVAPFMGLETNVSMQIGDLQAPAGTILLACLRHSGQLATDYADSAVFRPERWLEEGDAIANDSPTRKLFPFGGGPRFCPGRFLAMAEVRMVTSMIARNFHLHYDTEAPPVQEQFTFTMTPSAVPIRLSLRR